MDNLGMLISLNCITGREPESQEETSEAQGDHTHKVEVGIESTLNSGGVRQKY